MENYPIDIVIAWVDGKDPDWRKQKAKFTNENVDIIHEDSRELRYCDLGTLRFLFRGIEKFAPWVRTIHFVTCGHLPEWLNTNNSKLHVVKHEDYIPEEYLPTFSSHTIELNFHRIEGLSEHFIYFNDDMFLTNYTKKEDFFYKGMPRDIAAINARWFVSGNTPAYVQIQDTAIINKYFSKNEVIKKNFFKWFNLKYGLLIFRTIALCAWPKFITLHTTHLPSSLLKSTFEIVWDKEYEVLNKTCKNKIRNYLDVNQWLISFWQICTGNFSPAPIKRGKGFIIGQDESMDELAYRTISSGRYKMICVGEADEISDEDRINENLVKNFSKILPQKSSIKK